MAEVPMNLKVFGAGTEVVVVAAKVGTPEFPVLVKIKE
jgi:hypothetical protein